MSDAQKYVEEGFRARLAMLADIDREADDTA